MTAGTLDLHALAFRRRGVRGLMLEVMVALVPGTLLAAWLIAPGVLANVALAVCAALVLEALVARARARPVLATLGDGSIALAAWLLALTLPPALPAWQVLVGVAAMVLLGKQVYGGLGHNPFNPAMVGYAVLIVSFPLTMTTWPASAGGPPPDASGVAAERASHDWDAVTAATPLDRLRTLDRTRTDEATAGLAGSRSSDDARTSVDADADAVILGSAWPWVNGGFLLGGLWLLARGVIGWRIPLSLLGTLGTLHAVHGLLSSTPQPSAGVSLLAGAAILGAFFIATDPVSAASGPRARLVYGSSIGALTFVFREFGAYPEGIAFAVLLANATVPVLDRIAGTRPAPS